MSKEKGNINTFAQRLKAALLAFQGEPVKFMSAKLADGQMVEIEGDTLAQGVVVSIMTEAGAAPLPDGEYALEDGTVFVVSGGSVSEVKQPAATEDQAMADQSGAPTGAHAQSAPNPTQIIERIEKEMLFEKIAKIDELTTALAAIKTEFAAIKSENENLKTENVKFSKMVNEMSAALVEFGDQPQEEAPKKTEPVAADKKETIEEFRKRVFKQ